MGRNFPQEDQQKYIFEVGASGTGTERREHQGFLSRMTPVDEHNQKKKKY